nr:MAG TPA: Menin, Histone-lysine N-methyltransferase MLL [Caudoviricetes sp.]
MNTGTRQSRNSYLCFWNRRRQAIRLSRWRFPALPARPSSSVKSLKPSAKSTCVLSLSAVSQWTAEAGTQTQ